MMTLEKTEVILSKHYGKGVKIIKSDNELFVSMPDGDGFLFLSEHQDAMNSEEIKELVLAIEEKLKPISSYENAIKKFKKQIERNANAAFSGVIKSRIENTEELVSKIMDRVNKQPI